MKLLKKMDLWEEESVWPANKSGTRSGLWESTDHIKPEFGSIRTDFQG